MSNSTYIAQLNYASLQMHRYVPIGLLLFGIIGNSMSCLVFLQKSLRTNPCAMCFLAASIANLVSLIDGIPSRMLSSWNILPDLTDTNAVLCKCRITVLFISRNIASWLLVFAAVDRYLISSSNVNIRQKSNTKQAYIWIGLVCLGSTVIWIESAYCFDANLIGTPVKCYAKSDACRVINDLAQSLMTTIIPSTIMMIVGLYTIKNIQQSHRVGPTSVSHTIGERRRKTDHNLTKMLFAQVMLLTIFNVPQAIQKFYLTATFYHLKSADQRALENLIFNIVLLMTYVANCMPFYLYILTSHSFRTLLCQWNRNTLRCAN